MPVSPNRRYRCTSCGNLTRFTVAVTRRTKEFHHFTLGGDLSVEDVEVVEETFDDVTCRWCNSGAAVELIAPDDERRSAGA